MSRRAVIAGVNDYSAQNSLPPGWSIGNLGCCLADVQSMQGLLQDAFLFDQVKVLTDAAATRDAIIAALRDMLTASGPGDVACFVYSGHGGRFPADPASPGRYYEAIIPASGSPITDLDLYGLASQLDQSVVNFTLILDSCYSGGIHEDTPDSTIRSAGYSDGYLQACVSDMGTVIPCGMLLPPGSSALDGNVSNVVGQGNGVVCSVDDNKSLIPVSKSTVIAACRYDETATEQNGHGALTQGLLDAITQSNPSVSYLELIDQLRDDLQNKLGVTQTPTLLGQENRQDLPILAPWDTSA
jgi:caspase domain-containing protein